MLISKLFYFRKLIEVPNYYVRSKWKLIVITGGSKKIAEEIQH